MEPGRRKDGGTNPGFPAGQAWGARDLPDGSSSGSRRTIYNGSTGTIDKGMDIQQALMHGVGCIVEKGLVWRGIRDPDQLVSDHVVDEKYQMLERMKL